jgi:hypothetical protein
VLVVAKGQVKAKRAGKRVEHDDQRVVIPPSAKHSKQANGKRWFPSRSFGPVQDGRLSAERRHRTLLEPCLPSRTVRVDDEKSAPSREPRDPDSDGQTRGRDRPEQGERSGQEQNDREEDNDERDQEPAGRTAVRTAAGLRRHCCASQLLLGWDERLVNGQNARTADVKAALTHAAREQRRKRLVRLG